MARQGLGGLGVAVLCALVDASTGAHAQTPIMLDAAARRDLVDSTAAQIERIYVDAGTARTIAARLRDRLREGAYDAASDPHRFALLLTTDLRSVNHDLHLEPTGAIVFDLHGRLDVAHDTALDRSAHDENRRQQLLRIGDVVNAQLRPHEVSASVLAQYAGDYEGGRQLAVRDARLFYTPLPPATPEILMELSDSVFVTNAQVRFTFEADERGAMRIRARTPEGNTQLIQRAAATSAVLPARTPPR